MSWGEQQMRWFSYGTYETFLVVDPNDSPPVAAMMGKEELEGVLRIAQEHGQQRPRVFRIGNNGAPDIGIAVKGPSDGTTVFRFRDGGTCLEVPWCE